jgi:hypothetical protein
LQTAVSRKAAKNAKKNQEHMLEKDSLFLEVRLLRPNFGGRRMSNNKIALSRISRTIGNELPIWIVTASEETVVSLYRIEL